MSGIDYYRILGVSPSATRRAIREAYLGKVRRLHPDRVGADGTALFQQITEAYENLSDPKKRRAYDRARCLAHEDDPRQRGGLGFGVPVEPLVTRPAPTGYASAGRDTYGVGDLFQLLLDEQVNPFASSPASDPIELEVWLSPQEARRGAVLALRIPVVRTCPWCGGGGRRPFVCGGCGGRGELVAESLIHIHIPAGVRDRSVMEVPLGLAGTDDGNLRLYISVENKGGLGGF